MTVDLRIDFQGTGRLKALMRKQGYGDKAIYYYLEKPFMGSLSDPDMSTSLTGDCGDTVDITIKMDQDRIRDARFEVKGCAGSVSSAMALADMIRGKTLDEAFNIKDGEIFFKLGSVPDDKVHCIQLAVQSLQNVIKEYRNRKQEQG